MRMHWPRFFRALETLKLVFTEPAHPAAIGPHPRFRDALSITTRQRARNLF